MHLLKPALFMAASLLVSASSVAEEATELTQSALTAPEVGQAPQDSSQWAFPPDVTKIDPNCPGANEEIFRVTLDGLLWRIEHGGSHLLLLNATTQGAPMRYSDDLDLGFKPGARLSMAYSMEEGAAFEVNYFGIFGWSAEDYVSNPYNSTAKTGGLRVPDTLGTSGLTAAASDFTVANAMDIYYSVSLNSVEANLLFGKEGGSIKTIFGFRFLRFDEDFNIRAYNDFGSPPAPPAGYSDYHIGTKNELAGVQAGIHAELPLTHRLQLEGFAKLGIYNNNAQQETFLSDKDRTVVLRNFNPHQSVTAGVGDFNVTADYSLNQKWLLRVGYNALIISGIARAPAQLNFAAQSNAGNTINFNEQAFIHGLNAGIEGRF